MRLATTTHRDSSTAPPATRHSDPKTDRRDDCFVEAHSTRPLARCARSVHSQRHPARQSRRIETALHRMSHSARRRIPSSWHVGPNVAEPSEHRRADERSPGERSRIERRQRERLVDDRLPSRMFSQEKSHFEPRGPLREVASARAASRHLFRSTERPRRGQRHSADLAATSPFSSNTRSHQS